MGLRNTEGKDKIKQLISLKSSFEKSKERDDAIIFIVTFKVVVMGTHVT